eukprot:TRINITY_DN10975_c0_g1_i2.p1 TRINITY_DN10975_c0_g1~~TRINITY_DN10975_c0_g1_i2.p1  ORF type:complete len:214 (+),score=69.19 TRINITY_DN10975_c0_g1_i2:34-642(+)
MPHSRAATAAADYYASVGAATLFTRASRELAAARPADALRWLTDHFDGLSQPPQPCVRPEHADAQWLERVLGLRPGAVAEVRHESAGGRRTAQPAFGKEVCGALRLHITPGSTLPPAAAAAVPTAVVLKIYIGGVATDADGDAEEAAAETALREARLETACGLLLRRHDSFSGGVGAGNLVLAPLLWHAEGKGPHGQRGAAC